MHDDWNGVDASFFRPARSFRRDWHYPATFDTQLLEIIPQTKHGRVHIATSCKAITEAHHVRSARSQDLFRSSFPCASVSRAPCSCDRNRNKDGYMARRTVSPIPSLLLFQQISLKLHTLHCCPPPYHLFRKASRRIGGRGRATASAASSLRCLPIIRASRAQGYAATPTRPAQRMQPQFYLLRVGLVIFATFVPNTPFLQRTADPASSCVQPDATVDSSFTMGISTL
ncbi:hypothetical protein ACVINW_003621 [Bradyrhizobium sp. USDA 4461]